MNSYRHFRFDRDGETLVFSSFDNQLPELIYWGNELPEDEDIEALVRNSEHFCSPAQLSTLERISVLPELGRAFMGYPGIQVMDQEKPLLTQFRLEDIETGSSNDKKLWTFISRFSGLAELELRTCYAWYESKIIVTHQSLINLGSQIKLNWMSSPVFPIPEGFVRFQIWGGKWIKEFQKTEINLNRDVFLRENRRGRTSHENFPAIIFKKTTTNQVQGEALGFHLAWSGNHRQLIEQLPNGDVQFQIGALTEPGEIVLEKGDSFTTPQLYAIRSIEGINGIRKGFHTHIRTHLIHNLDRSPRKVHSNSWEVSYFDHNLDRLKRLIDQAFEMGAERFVLDDGWFQGRHDDSSSLGDWEVDAHKYPNDLFPLIDYIKERKMSFGIWLEPEMVSPDSNLYRTHPDWVLGEEYLESSLGRNQRVLDLTRTEVYEYIWKVLSGIIEKYRPDYIKWDHNRILTQSVKNHRQTQALYRLWKSLKENYPEVELESCASGGGRIDLGILKYADRFWLSDSNDPVERWKMQLEATTFLPPEIIGSHVGSERCHTSNRITDIDFRSWVALSCHFGYEVDLEEMRKEEKEILKVMTQYYLDHRSFLHSAYCLVLQSPSKSIHPLFFLSPEQDQFLLMVGVLDSEDTTGSRMLCLTGLKGNEYYRIRLLFINDRHQKLNLNSSSDIFSDKGIVLSGAGLMDHGFRLPISMPLTMWVMRGEILKDKS